MGRKSKQKNWKKGFLITCYEAIVYQNLSKVGGFLAAAEVLLKCYE